ncbi:peptidoglycan editing factor PgeF [Ornithinimicrobium avium]|uniref:Purine nucleoside phosphorylase n=1 Tax=Ornithinimicrobium avium TaxID=2283195 RepID=A0A345NKT8_9MICO|nr:peptidoglycan editing factor PgeF [Ornithinimicrobium avium]AXH95646.1 peptidoglycan editing factor PgeF [Ornithinimicrobium avium]
MFFWRERIEPSGAACGVELAFTDRRGGSSQAPFDGLNLALHVGDRDDAVTTNRRRLANELGLRLDDLRFMDQVHGCAVALTPGTVPGEGAPHGAVPPTADGIVSGRTDEALVVMVADCVPVLLLDRTVGLVAAVHAGRGGLVKGVVPAAVSRLRDLGAHDLEAVLGPSICAGCYEVPAELRDEAASVAPAAAAVSSTGTPAIDVAAGVVEQLGRDGVSVRRLPGCTRENPDLYSYRRDGRTGRFVGVVRLLDHEEAA